MECFPLGNCVSSFFFMFGLLAFGWASLWVVLSVISWAIKTYTNDLS